jgi:hypothetical protein
MTPPIPLRYAYAFICFLSLGASAYCLGFPVIAGFVFAITGLAAGGKWIEAADEAGIK